MVYNYRSKADRALIDKETAMNENKDNEIKVNEENNPEQEMPRFYFPSELSDKPAEIKLPTPAPEREYHHSVPTNLFGGSEILNIPALKNDEPAPIEDEPTVDSIYDGPPKLKKAVLILIPIVALLLVLTLTLTALFVVAGFHKPDRSNDLFDPQGLLCVKSENSPTLWGFINKDGEVVIDYQFLSAKPFTEFGLAAVMVRNYWGYINRSGDLVIDATFVEAYPFDEHGIAVVKDNNNLYGMIDKSGNYVVEPAFNMLSPFNEFGFAYAVNSNNGYRIGLIKRQGFEFIDLKASSIYPFSTDGYASLNGGRLIDKNGNIIEISMASGIQASTIDQAYFGNELVWVIINEKYGYINDRFELAIDCKFKKAEAFSANGLAGVQFEDGTYGYINKNGETVISLAEYDVSGIGNFNDAGWTTVSFGSYDLVIPYDSLSNDSLSTVAYPEMNIMNEKGEFLFEEPLSYLIFRELGDMIVVGTRLEDNSYKFTAYDKNGDEAFSIEGTYGSIRVLDESFIIDDVVVYDFDGNILADLREYGNEYDHFAYAGNVSDHMLYLAYDIDKAETQNLYFIFDQKGQLVAGPVFSWNAPSFYADGYIITSYDSGTTTKRYITKMDGNLLSDELLDGVRDFVAYSTVASYFESGLNGSRYFSGGFVDPFHGGIIYK